MIYPRKQEPDPQKWWVRFLGALLLEVSQWARNLWF